jgi:phosphoribosylamine--glycine ligase
MNILLIGSGGREHALAWKLNQSSLLTKLFIAPGNAGTATLGENVNLSVLNFDEVGQFSIKHKIDLIVVGPEEPLVNGFSDYFAIHDALKHINVVGPKSKGAQLEGSKDFSKIFMQKHQIPTAAYQTFKHQELEEACQFIDQIEAPYVLKADGLAAGKGVLILNDAEEAKQELAEMLKGKFGKASQKVVIEAFLKGIEMSVFVITDGKNYQILPEAKDYKRIGEGDKGLNTGGMGAISPVPFADDELMQKVEEQIIKPTISGLQNDQIEYCGFIFIGLMIVNNEPFVIEYNCRLGDPETEVVIPRLETDLVLLFNSLFDGTLQNQKIVIKPKTALTVMAVSAGYPEQYEKGFAISGLENVGNESIVFHAATSADSGEIKTNGGRVLTITSLGNNLAEASQKSYNSMNKICYENIYYRKDIGYEFK